MIAWCHHVALRGGGHFDTLLIWASLFSIIIIIIITAILMMPPLLSSGLQGSQLPSSLPPVVRGLLAEGIALNTTAHLTSANLGPHGRVLGNKTEGALLMMMENYGIDYRPVSEGDRNPKVAGGIPESVKGVMV
jgi:hypothetical protein